MTKKIFIVGTKGIPARYGGFETLAENIGLRLCIDHNLTVICEKQSYHSTKRQKEWKGIQRRFISLKANGIQSILYDLSSLLISCRQQNIIILLGASAALFIPVIRILKPRIKIILHIDGLEWRRKKWNLFTRVYLRLSTYIGVLSSHKIILDSPHLSSFLPKNTHNKVQYISYGVEHTNIYPATIGLNSDFWLSICRSEPENQLDIIASCFSELPKRKWILISNFEDTVFGRRLYKQYKKCKNIAFIQATFDNKVLQEYRNKCVGYIHGHTAGGTNPSLIEAMANCDRVLCHDNPFNRTTTNNMVNYFKTKDDLKQLLINLPEAPIEKIKELREYTRNTYSWEKVSRQYKEIINQLL